MIPVCNIRLVVRVTFCFCLLYRQVAHIRLKASATDTARALAQVTITGRAFGTGGSYQHKRYSSKNGNKQCFHNMKIIMFKIEC